MPVRLPDLLWQSVYSRLAGYEDLNDAQRLSTDPTFRTQTMGPECGPDIDVALVRDGTADP